MKKRSIDWYSVFGQNAGSGFSLPNRIRRTKKGADRLAVES